jgi:hypothetical protein
VLRTTQRRKDKTRVWLRSIAVGTSVTTLETVSGQAPTHRPGHTFTLDMMPWVSVAVSMVAVLSGVIAVDPTNMPASTPKKESTSTPENLQAIYGDDGRQDEADSPVAWRQTGAATAMLAGR